MSKKFQNNLCKRDNSSDQKKPVPKPDPNLRQHITKKEAQKSFGTKARKPEK